MLGSWVRVFASLCSDQPQKTCWSLLRMDGWRNREASGGPLAPKQCPPLWFRSSWSCLCILITPLSSRSLIMATEETLPAAPAHARGRHKALALLLPALTDVVAFHYFPVTYTNTTFNKLSKLQLRNKNRFLCNDCWDASLLEQNLAGQSRVHGLHRSLSSPAHWNLPPQSSAVSVLASLRSWRLWSRKCYIPLESRSTHDLPL